MIAFEILGRPVYRYGLFYLITFLFAYIVLYRLARTTNLGHLQLSHVKLFHLLRENLDDIFLLLMCGVIVGGRLGHVLFYDLGYYLLNISEIIMINKGGMSFVGGIIGVSIVLGYIKQKYKLSRRDFLLFGDFILLIVPLGSLLGRIGNYLNQELIGRDISELPIYIGNFLTDIGLTTVYTSRDSIQRVNINYIQSFFEGGVLLVLTRIMFYSLYMNKSVRVGTISGVYLIGYGIIRFIMEYMKDLPLQEVYGIFSVSQLLSIALVCFGIYILRLRKGLQ